MCGICGYTDFSRASDEATLRAMTDAIYERGPDQCGHALFDSDHWRLAIGHRRLSILDVSDLGRQPMQSASGRFTIALNGEIYNYAELRQMLQQKQATSLRGHSDTEVLVNFFEVFGVEASLGKLVGMFAFALWDNRDRVLYLARDRMGEKPLYYGWQGNVFLFASDIKALEKHPATRREIDQRAVYAFLEQSNIPAPLSIYKGISKLLPGHCLKIDLTRTRPGDPLTPLRYWDLMQLVANAQAQSDTISYDEAKAHLKKLLLQSVSGQLVADVPLGAFLSGGVDSSLIVAAMQALGGKKAKTFTIGFDEDAYNEAPYAKAIAEHLQTEHHEFYLSKNEVLETIPLLPSIYSEPFADPSQIPTLLVSRMAKQHVTVALSGDAGDELFLGYPRYDLIARRRRRYGSQPLNAMLNAAYTLGGKQVINALRNSSGYPALFSYKAERLLRLARCKDRKDFYRQSIARFPNVSAFIENSGSDFHSYAGYDIPEIANDIDLYSTLDLIDYLPNNCLVKVDRAAMHESLETRTPLLDHRIVEFAVSLPAAIKCHNNSPKQILKDILYEYVPRTLIERPKRGFSFPVNEWLRGGLKEWASELMSERALRESPVPWNVKNTTHLFNQLLRGDITLSYNVWNILMLQVWLRRA